MNIEQEENTTPEQFKWLELEGELTECKRKNQRLLEALLDARLHFTMKTFSKRPCTTCDLVSELIGEPFGCKKLALKELNK